MTEPTPFRSSPARAVPAAVPFDSRGGALPPSITPPEAPPGAVVLLVSLAADSAWAAETAIALAAEWGHAGRRVVLADLHVEDPLLHDLVGEPNLDGVVDIFLYGASLARSARPVRGRGFYLISAGTYPPDPDAVFRHPRWEKLVAGFRDAQASLVLFVPPQPRTVAALASWADEAVLLGRGGDDTDAVLNSLSGLPIRGHIVPVPAASDEAVSPAPGAPEPPSVAEELPTETGADRSAVPAVAADRDRTYPYSHATKPGFARRNTGPADEVVAVHHTPAAKAVTPPWEEEELPVELPPPPVRVPRGRRRGRVSVSPFVWVLVVLALIAASALLFGDFDAWFGGNRAATRVVGPTASAGPLSPPPTSTAVPLPYSVRIAGFESLSAARDEIAGARAASGMGDVLFYLSPEMNADRLYYHVMAGALPDSAAAERLRNRVDEADLLDSQDLLARLVNLSFTPLAFQLGDLPTREAAQARTDSLLNAQVPAYLVALPFSDGSRAWRVYGGAYADSIAAQPMRRLLADAGLSTQLTPRTGEPAVAATTATPIPSADSTATAATADSAASSATPPLRE